MRRSVIVLLTLALACTAASAQPATMPVIINPSKPARPKLPTIEQKLRYICKQLDLNEKQRQHVEGLFAILAQEAQATPEDIREHLDQIQVVYQEMMAAREAGKEELAEELREKLQSLSPEVKAANNFSAGLLPALTDEQRVKFEKLRKELADVTDLSLKPAQVVELARRFKLTADQEDKLAALQTAFRKQMNESPDDEQRRATLLDKFVADVGALLDAPQRADFLKQIDMLRPDEPARSPATQPARPPTTQPAATQPAP